MRKYADNFKKKSELYQKSMNNENIIFKNMQKQK